MSLGWTPTILSAPIIRRRKYVDVKRFVSRNLRCTISPFESISVACSDFLNGERNAVELMANLQSADRSTEQSWSQFLFNARLRAKVDDFSLGRLVSI